MPGMNRLAVLAAAAVIAALAAAAPCRGAAPGFGAAPADTAAADTAAAKAAAAGAGGYRVEGAVIDRIVAIVEDRPILQSEFEMEVRRFLMQAGRTEVPADQEKQLRREILDAMIADLLMTIQAEKDGIKVDDREVEASVDRMIEQNREAIGGEEAFQKQLAAEQLTIEQLRNVYREKLRARELIRGLMLQKTRSEAGVTEGEMRSYYREHLAEFPKRPATVTLAHILIEPAVSEAAREKGLARIKEIEKRIRAGEDFASVAKEDSDCPSAPTGGSLGYIAPGDLSNPEFERVAAELKPGETSEPVLTRFGWHLIKVEDVRGEERLVRHILVRVEAGAADLDSAAKLADSLRAAIAAGADFAKAAAAHSADAETKESGGLLGEAIPSNLPEQLRTAIAGVGAGELAPALKDANGFRIIKVVSWNPERTYSYDEAREELQRLLAEQKGRERLASYIQELKKQYHVEAKEDL